VQVVLLSLVVAIADVSVAVPQPSSTLPESAACGGEQVRQLRAAIERYCSDEAAASEALGCRVARYAFSHCKAMPALSGEDDQTLRGSIRDPRDQSYAWMLTFARLNGRWMLERFQYDYDDCDAVGVPAPPRGKLRLRELERGPDDRD
jgi:hypothetical protein